MKSTNSALIAFLDNNATFYYADLYTIALTNGTVLNYTAADLNLTVGGVKFVCNDVLISGGPKITQQTGLTVNEADITLYPGPNSMAGAVSFFQAASNGIFNRASVTVQRLFMSSWGSTALPAVTIFVGEITDIDATRNQIDIKVKDNLNLLNIYMPRRQYQPTCSWVFGDSNCGFDRAGSAVATTALAGTTQSQIITSLTQTSGVFNSGTVRATSGLNAGTSRTIKAFSNGTFSLVAPFPQPFGIGDALTVTPGCNKNYAGQQQSFSASTLNGTSPSVIICGLTNAPGFFNGATLQFTSGPNVGLTGTVAIWDQNEAFMAAPFPNQPNTPGGTGMSDTFVLNSSASNTTGSCDGYFGADNALHFGGQPFVPVPETAM